MNENEIRVLENHVVNQIAAGEVVERPASVVKELVENSIDAGATAVTVEISEGGAQLIRVTDNGSGIVKEQAALAFTRHATSKIRKAEDLDGVTTMGFRGEALSSICAVARVEMVTKRAEEPTGLRLQIHGGEIVSQGDIGTVDGTTIIVRNLFYNTPARRKFLKRTSTEAGYISDIMERLALANPGIAFKFINTGAELMRTKGGGSLRAAVSQVYGREVEKLLMDVDFSEDALRVYGLAGKPELSRGSRAREHLFLNGRCVRSDLVRAAVEEAYKTKVGIGKFPFYILNLWTDPAFVDVNVHPAKLEVRFGNENLVYSAFLRAVDAALKRNVLIPLAQFSQREMPKAGSLADGRASALFSASPDVAEPPAGTGPSGPAPRPDSAHNPPARPDNNAEAAFMEEPARYTALSRDSRPVNNDLTEIIIDDSESAPEMPGFHNFMGYKILGQVFNTYWVVEQGSSVYIFDQHAAHERILYERFTAALDEGRVPSQPLLRPVAVRLTLSEAQLLAEYGDLFTRLGFELEQSPDVPGGSPIILKAVPFIFNAPLSEINFIEILDRLADRAPTDKSPLGKTAGGLKPEAVAMMACKAAVKGNAALTREEAAAMVEVFMTLENPFTCPHGRPTVIELTKRDLEREFGRT
ncbi:MAG: DNA mismatch repair endonuclease MutL [Clostridiales bacterium]|jgi:DNA mismatch repair protein MutL|nr:DNA mismatch repair endonuclease MutL [Clostridiales bacterium]